MQAVFLRLPRGTVPDSDHKKQTMTVPRPLQTRISFTVTVPVPLLPRAAYHLGNAMCQLRLLRPILRLSPDPVSFADNAPPVGDGSTRNRFTSTRTRRLHAYWTILLCCALQLASPALPVGAYSYSRDWKL